jgi:hypothetical protein
VPWVPAKPVGIVRGKSFSPNFLDVGTGVIPTAKEQATWAFIFDAIGIRENKELSTIGKQFIKDKSGLGWVHGYAKSVSKDEITQ